MARTMDLGWKDFGLLTHSHLTGCSWGLAGNLSIPCIRLPEFNEALKGYKCDKRNWQYKRLSLCQRPSQDSAHKEMNLMRGREMVQEGNKFRAWGTSSLGLGRWKIGTGGARRLGTLSGWMLCSAVPKKVVTAAVHVKTTNVMWPEMTGVTCAPLCNHVPSYFKNVMWKSPSKMIICQKPSGKQISSRSLIRSVSLLPHWGFILFLFF